MFCQPMILFGVERLMKNKLKTRLFAALALSGASVYWPVTAVVAQVQGDDFGFIQPVEPTRQDDQEAIVPPITRVNPPVSNAASPSKLLRLSNTVRPPAAMPQIVQPPVVRRPSAPLPFASSNVFNGTYVEPTTNSVGNAQHLSPAQNTQSIDVQQVSHDESLGNPSPSTAISAKRDLPPIVTVAKTVAGRVNQPFEQNELPPILRPSQTLAEPGLPPIVTPTAGVDRLRSPAEISDGSVKLAQDNNLLLNANESALNEESSVKPAAFGASPLLVQDAPPTFGVDNGSIVPGALPSTAGELRPVDPVVDLSGSGSRSSAGSGSRPSAGSGSRPQGTLQSESVAPESVVHGALPATTPRETYFQPVAQQPGVFGGCATCGTPGGSCGCGGASHGVGVGSCASCGDGGCFDPAAVEEQFNNSGANAYARRYLIAEALYFNRTDGTISNSNFGTLSNFDAAGGARVTVGRRTDSTRGTEFQYSGIDSVEETQQIFSPGGLANASFLPSGGLNLGNLQSFFNATEQTQSTETYFHSLEFNRVKWGWDVIKSYVGVRYLYVDDEYSLFSQSGPPFAQQNGSFETAAVNHLIGPIIGGELYYDVGYRWSLSGVSRAGAYLNINRFDTHLTNDNIEFIDAEDDSTTIAFSYEFGINAKYRLTNQAQFRIGYNILFLDNVSTVSNNLTNDVNGNIPISPTFGTSTSDSGDIFFHGLSLGFEIYR